MRKADATQAPEPQRKPGAPERAPGVPPQKARKPRFGRPRHLFRAFLVAMGLLTALVILITQSGLLRVLVIPRLESLVGAKILAGRTTIDRGGELVIQSPELRNPQPGLSDLASQFIKADELRVAIDWSALWHARLELSRVVLVRPVIRISQDRDLKLNIKEVIDHLAASSPAGAPTITRLPELRVAGASIELGEHDDGPPPLYKELTSLRVSGTIKPDPDAPTRYIVDFSEERPEGSSLATTSDPLRGAKRPGLGSAITSPKMRVQGTLSVNPAAADITLTNVDLTEIGRRQAPTWFHEVWGDLRLAGEIPTVHFGFSPQQGLRMSFDVVGVTMNIPIPTEPDLDANGDPIPGATTDRKLMAMQGVTGKIALTGRGVEAELNGNIEDFPLIVRLKTEGRELNSALSCDLESRGFLVQKRPMLLPFAPPFVRFLFQRLGGPTMEAEGVVKLRRDPPNASGEPGEIRVAGSLKFKNGTAAHELFAYPISQLSGVMEFDATKIELLNIKGSNPNGAKLLASGVISPPDETAAAKVLVTVVDVPVDDLFREALPEKRRIVYDALADTTSYNAFRAANLIQSTQDKQNREQKLNELRTNLAMGERFGGGAGRMADMAADAARIEREINDIPIFDLGGLAQMEINVTRELGATTETKADVHFTSPRIGIMMKAFPLPLIARNLDLQLGGSRTTFKPITVSTPTGGTGTVTGRVDYPDGGGLQPWVDITANALPLDPIFVRALPDPPTARGVTARKLVHELNFTGAVDGYAVVRPDPNDPESASFRVDLAASNLSARPAHGELTLTDIHGGVSVFDGAVEVPYLSGLVEGVPFELSAHAWYGGDDPTTLFGTVSSPAIDLSLPIENLIAPGSPVAAKRVASLRAERLPTGCAAGEVVITDAGGDSATSALIRLDGLTAGSFQAPGGRFEVDSASGLVGVTADTVSFADFHVTAPPPRSAPNEPGTDAAIDGSLALTDIPATSLHIRATAARFESTLVRSLASMSGSDVESFINETQPAGAFNAEVTHRRNTKAPGLRESEGWIEPRTLSLTRRGVRINLPECSGRFAFDPLGGRFDNLTAKAATWWATANGRYENTQSNSTAPLGDDVALDLTLSVGGDAIAPDLRAALPAAVSQAMSSIELGETGAFEMRDAVVKLSPAHGTTFKGSVGLQGVTLKPVVPITQANGTIEVVAAPKQATNPQGKQNTLVTLDVSAKSFTLAGIHMTGGTAKVIADAATGEVRVPRFAAICHGGQLSAQGSLGAGTGEVSASGGGRPFEFAADLSNIRFGDFLADLYPKSALDDNQVGTVNETNTPAVDRGRLDGSFSVAGLLGKTSTRRGRGLLRVQDGEVLNMPAVVPILRLSNLQPPVNERIGFGYADFYIQGETLRFDEFTLQSKSLAIDGRGTVTWPGLGVDMRFVTRSLDRIPLLTDLLEGLRDELVTTTVSGTLSDPQLKYEQLSSTRQMLEQMFSKKKRDERPEASSDQPVRRPEQ